MQKTSTKRNTPKTSRSRNLTKQNATKPLQDSLSESISSKQPSLNSQAGLPPLNLDSMNTTHDTSTSQFPNLTQAEMSNLSQLIGISDASESETEEEKPKKPDRFTKMHDELMEQAVALGMIITTIHEADGLVILQRADPLATKIVNVAKQNPAVYKAIKKYLEGSVYTVLALEIGTICNAILANHGVNVGGIMGFFKRGDSGESDVRAVA